MQIHNTPRTHPHVVRIINLRHTHAGVPQNAFANTRPRFCRSLELFLRAPTPLGTRSTEEHCFSRSQLLLLLLLLLRLVHRILLLPFFLTAHQQHRPAAHQYQGAKATGGFDFAAFTHVCVRGHTTKTPPLAPV